MSGAHATALGALGLPPQVARGLGAYLDLLAAWSARVNLTGARTPEARVDLLVRDVVVAAPEVEDGPLLDVGSGNGSPGLVLALLRPEITVTLLEPRAHRWAFLREAARAIGRADVHVVRARHDGYGGPPARTLTLRGLALPLEQIAGLVEGGGRVLVFGGNPRPSGPFEWEAVRPLSRARLHVFRRRRST